MFKKHFSFGRAAFTALVLLVSFGFISCQPETVIKYVEKPVEVEKKVEVEKRVEYLVPGAIYTLTEDDPICGDFSGNFGSASFYTDIAFATACSATNLDDVTGKEAGSYFTFSTYDYLPPDYSPVLVNKYFDKDSNPIYVIYNKFDDSDEADIHSGIIVYKAKYSPYDSPAVGAYYGIKFQFLEAEHKVPETRTRATVYTNDLYIEGGYNSDVSYNNVSDLATAVEKFAFDNTAYFSEASWCWAYSGATKQ